MKKILFVSPRFHTNLFHTIKHLKSKNYEIRFLASNKQLIEDYTYIKPIILKTSHFSLFISKILKKYNKNNRFYFPKFNKLYFYIIKYKPNLIILRNFNKFFGLMVVIVSKLLGIKIIFYEQLSYSFFKKKKIKLIYYSIRNFLLNSYFYTPVFKNFNKINFIYNFFYIPFLVDIKKKRYLQKKTIKILFVGKFIPRKNLLLLLKTLYKLDNKYDFQLTIIGEASKSEHYKFLKYSKKFIKKKNFNNKIIIKTNLKYRETIKYYKESDLFILPSKAEPASISVLEAMGYGIPVICSKGNGASFYVKNYYSGLLFDEDNEKQLLDRILFFFKNTKKIKTFSNNCYLHMKKNFSHIMFDKYFEKIIK